MQKITPRKSERSSRSSRYSDFSSDEEAETRTKETFLQQRLKQSIDSHLNSWKQNKSAQNTASSINHSKKLHSNLFTHRKNQSQRAELQKSDEIQNTVKKNYSNLEEIFEIIQKALSKIEDLEPDLNLRSCQANLNKALNMLNNELKNSKLLLKFLENFIQKQASETNSTRKFAEKQFKAEIQDLSEKFERIIDELLEKNQELQERNKEILENNQELFRTNQELTVQMLDRKENPFESKVQSLERLLAEAHQQIVEKTEEVLEKNEEISKLEQYAATLNEDLEKVNSDLKDLERFLQYQQESSQSQIKQLLTEIEKLQKHSEKLAKSSEKQQSDLKTSADSYKNQFTSVYSALSRADEELEYMKSTFIKKEAVLKQENLELQSRNECLEKLVKGLRKDLEIAQDRIEAREFIVGKCKDEEIGRLQETLNRFHEENTELHKSNKELLVANQKLEEKVLKASQDKAFTPIRSEKKRTKSKKL